MAFTIFTEKMPHKRSSGSKLLHQRATTARKWFKILEANFNSLWRDIDAALGQQLKYMYIYGCDHDWLAKPSWSQMNQEPRVSRNDTPRIHIRTHAGEVQAGMSMLNVFYKREYGLALQDIYIVRPQFSLGYEPQAPQLLLDAIQTIVHAWAVRTIGMEMCRRRSARIREELVAAVWHPRRVARMLEAGGWDALENM
jgi:hypothetical protein